MHDQLENLAARVDAAAMAGESLTMLTQDNPELTIEQAYDVQRLAVARRIDRGETLVGMKMGLTSFAKMAQMGVHDPIYGHLTDAMQMAPGATLSLAGLIHPRVEPELAFTMASDLSGEPSEAEAMAAVASVHAAIEVIDSRYTDFKFTLIDVVADNTSACRYVIGDGVAPADLDLGDLELSMDVGGREQLSGRSSAILDHPAKSLARLAAMLSVRGEGLKAGQVVLAGAATAAVFVESGDRVALQVDGLPDLHFTVTD